MRRAGLSLLLVAAIVAAAVAGISATHHAPGAPSAAGRLTGEADGGSDRERSGLAGVETDGSVDADKVVRLGSAPRTERVEHAPTPGWAGAQLYSATGNDWEPAVAADPGAPYVVALTTRYNKGGAACGTCPVPYIIARVSPDGGANFGPDQYLCACLTQTHGQYDPQITADAAGNFYAAWIMGRNIVFSKSTTHGATWSPMVRVSPPVPWGDHPWITVGADGQDVYINFNHAESWIAASHDGGTTWDPPVRTSFSGFFHYAGGGFVASNGDVTFVDENYGTKGTQHVVLADSIWSHDDGATWHTTHVDLLSNKTPPCIGGSCYASFYGGHAAVAGDPNGDLVMTYDGSMKDLGDERVYVRRSHDAGQTWTKRMRLSPAKGVRVAGFPAIADAGVDDFRLWYQDNRRGSDLWNTWYRQSSDGGKTWSSDKRISDASSGTSYQHHKGYTFPYGDYGEIAVTNTGKSFAIWAEGKSYYGPGGTWYNVQT